MCPFTQCKRTIKRQRPGDGIDNDCDGKIDEEIRDGEDNDGDGRVDEDLALVRVYIIRRVDSLCCKTCVYTFV